MKKVINKIFIYIFMLIIIFISVIPFVYMVMMSFKSTTNAYDFDFSLEKLTLMQYQKIFSLANFPNYVFNHPRFLIIKNNGIIITSDGTTIVMIKKMNNLSFPLKSIFANAYPASEHTVTVRITPTTATNTLLNT